jgi:hypothetical protein
MLKLIVILLLTIIELFGNEYCPQPIHNSSLAQFTIDSNNYQQCLTRNKIELNENLEKTKKSSK